MREDATMGVDQGGVPESREGRAAHARPGIGPSGFERNGVDRIPEGEGKLFLHIGPSQWNAQCIGTYDVKIARKD